MLATCSSKTFALALVRLVMVLVIAITSLGVPSPALGQAIASEIKVFALTQQDEDGDGKPDRAIIDSAFATERDSILVYDRAGNMTIAETWQEATDFEDDFWVFDAAADGLVDLVIAFHKRQDGALEARLWDDQDGDGTVRYDPRTLAVTESPNPTLRVVAPDGWWLRDGKTNFNLDLTVDGRVRAAFSPAESLELATPDGKPEFQVQVRDTDYDNQPDYQWVNAWPGISTGQGVARTEITFNPDDDEPPIQGAIFWPYLGSTVDSDDPRPDRAARFAPELLRLNQAKTGFNKDYHISTPPVQMLWHKGVLRNVGEFVTARFNDNNWFVYSIERARPNTLAKVNFEAPFAFYDLGGDDDGIPELAIRFEQYREHSPFAFAGKNPLPVQIVRYSWDQDNDKTWDYKIGLIGRHQIEGSVKVGDLDLTMVPPAELPGWVTNRTWDGATFVVTEAAKSWTSEGIYEWGPGGQWRDQYVTGLSGSRPTDDELKAGLADLLVGQRGEYALDIHRTPQMYLSPIDLRLHLLGAQGGIWRVSENTEIHYANLGGDYVNKWTLVEQGNPVKSVYFASGQLIVEDASGIRIARSDQAPALFLTPPPTNNSERLALEQQLAQYSPESSLWHFESTTAPGQVRGLDQAVEGGSMHDFRLTKDGFRFALELQPGFRATNLKGLSLEGLAAGPYLVSFDGAFSVRPLTPPELSLSLQVPSANDLVLSAPLSILTEASNRGLSDATNLSLSLRARQGDDELTLLQKQLDVLSGVPTQSTLNWQPDSAGLWEVEARLEGPNGQIFASNQVVLEVTPGLAAPGQVLFSSGGEGWQAVVMGMMLSTLVITVTGLLWLALRPPVGGKDAHGQRS